MADVQLEFIVMYKVIAQDDMHAYGTYAYYLSMSKFLVFCLFVNAATIFWQNKAVHKSALTSRSCRCSPIKAMNLHPADLG